MKHRRFFRPDQSMVWGRRAFSSYLDHGYGYCQPFASEYCYSVLSVVHWRRMSISRCFSQEP